LAGCSGGSPLRAVHDGAATGGGGGENWDVPGATGGNAQGEDGAAIGGAGGTATGGSLDSSGGGTGPGGAAGASSTRGTGGATGGAMSLDGSPGDVQDGRAAEGVADAPPYGCDDQLLWYALASGAGVGAGYCCPVLPEYDLQGGFVRTTGYIVFDGDGRVVDNTGLSGAGKQAWLDGLATMRWPCFAGQTMQYMCIEYPI
jgi:hypothetical protein